MTRERKLKVVQNTVRIVLIIQVLLFIGIVVASAQNPATILDKAAATYKAANGITATFSIRTHIPQQNYTESFEGMIDMKGDKFVFKTPDMQTWFNGTTQWVYMDRLEEVNISNPTGEELQFTNPMILLGNYKKGFNAVYKGESTANNGKSAYDIELTPKSKSDIVKVELQIEKISGLPAGITVQDKNGMTSTIHISKVKTEVNQPDSFFVFNPKDFPDAEIIDLR